MPNGKFPLCYFFKNHSPLIAWGAHKLLWEKKKKLRLKARDTQLIIKTVWLATKERCSASIMAGGSHMQTSFNSIKLENPGYYCNSYTPPGPPDHHMLSTSGYSKLDLRLRQLDLVEWKFHQVNA